MFIRRLFLVLVLGFIALNLNAQDHQNLNNYKYVIVPLKYDFLNETDKYQLNSLTKFLFDKYGFTAYMENEEFPSDYSTNNCLALKSEVIKEKGVFKTKLVVKLKDCKGRVLFTSKMGESREKDFKKAFHEALRNAFESFGSLEYEYVPNNESEVVSQPVATENTQAEIEKLKTEIEELKSENREPSKVVAVTAGTSKVVSSEVPKSQTGMKTVVGYKTNESASDEVLYAQATNEGYQLVDSTPKIVYKLKKTGSSDMFLVESVNGVLTKKGDNWVLEYYENSVLKQKTLNIKF